MRWDAERRGNEITVEIGPIFFEDFQMDWHEKFYFLIEISFPLG